MAKMTRESFHVYQAHAKNALKQSEQVPSILICAGTGCIAGGSLKIYDYLKEECERRGLCVHVNLMEEEGECSCGSENSLSMKKSGCHGVCEMGPLLQIEPAVILYTHVKLAYCD